MKIDTHSHIRGKVCVFRMPVIAPHSIELRLLTPNAKANKLQVGVQSVMMTDISHTSCLRREKLSLASKVSALTAVWYDQMGHRNVKEPPKLFVAHPLTFKFSS